MIPSYTPSNLQQLYHLNRINPVIGEECEKTGELKIIINTKIDVMLEAVDKFKEITLKDLAPVLGLSEKTLLGWARILEKKELLTVNYGFFGCILKCKTP